MMNLQPGDLVFTYGGDHVGIYVGGGSYIHAPNQEIVLRYHQLLHSMARRVFIRCNFKDRDIIPSLFCV